MKVYYKPEGVRKDKRKIQFVWGEECLEFIDSDFGLKLVYMGPFVKEVGGRVWSEIGYILSPEDVSQILQQVSQNPFWSKK